jgi:hypothetical protein
LSKRIATQQKDADKKPTRELTASPHFYSRYV